MIRVPIHNGRELRLSKYSFQFFGHLPETQSGGAFLGHDQKIGGRRKCPLLQPEKFSDQTLYPIAFYRRPHLLSNRDPQPAVGEVVRAHGDSKMGGLIFRPRLGGPLEISPPPDSFLFSKAITAHLPRSFIFQDSLGLSIRPPRPPASFGPCSSGAAKPGARPWSTSASRNHGFFSGECCSVEKSSSKLLSCAKKCFHPPNRLFFQGPWDRDGKNGSEDPWKSDKKSFYPFHRA